MDIQYIFQIPKYLYNCEGYLEPSFSFVFNDFVINFNIHFDNLKVDHHISHLITLNEINGHPPIAVCDTSRFGDQKFDEKIVEMIGNLFKNWIDTIESICFVTYSSGPKLTTT